MDGNCSRGRAPTSAKPRPRRVCLGALGSTLSPHPGSSFNSSQPSSSTTVCAGDTSVTNDLPLPSFPLAAPALRCISQTSFIRIEYKRDTVPTVRLHSRVQTKIPARRVTRDSQHPPKPAATSPSLPILSVATMARNVCLLAAALAALARAAPEPTANPNANPVGAPEPAVTAMDINQIPTRTFKGRRRDILSDVNGDINSVLGGQSSYVASGVPQWYESLPTGDQVASSLSISDIQATPTSVNNFPPYANWTDQGWNVRFHGNIYRQRKYFLLGFRRPLRTKLVITRINITIQRIHLMTL